MKQTLITVILFLTCGYVFGQTKMTKNEILKNWNLPSNNHAIEPNVIVNSDSILNVYLTKIVDTLQLAKVDRLIIFSTALPGYISTSKCDTGIFPITSFVLWNKDEITHIRKVRGNCSSEISKDSLQYLFNFYEKNHLKIESEFFMPVILAGQMNRDKTVSYSMRWVDHEPNYSFFYKIGKYYKSFQFCQSYFDNKESLFHDYNLHLSAYHWWRLVKQEIDKVEKP